jgi:hypothetical protein
MLRLLVTANVPSSAIHSTLIILAISSSETSVLTRVTWRKIPEDGILQGTLFLKLRIYLLFKQGERYALCLKPLTSYNSYKYVGCDLIET